MLGGLLRLDYSVDVYRGKDRLYLAAQAFPTRNCPGGYDSDKASRSCVKQLFKRVRDWKVSSMIEHALCTPKTLVQSANKPRPPKTELEEGWDSAFLSETDLKKSELGIKEIRSSTFHPQQRRRKKGGRERRKEGKGWARREREEREEECHTKAY